VDERDSPKMNLLIEHEEAILKLYSERVGTRAIANRFSSSRYIVTRFLKSRKVKLRACRTTPYNPPEKLTSRTKVLIANENGEMWRKKH
jgi:hypothetical protein